jgi:nitroreductase
MRRVPALCEIEKKAGHSKEYVARLPATVSLFAGSGVVANGVKRALLHLTSPLRTSPSVSTTQAWSYKNASMVAMTVMLAAQAHGISSCPMEGFDARRVRHVLRLPERYEIPIIVTLGYPKDGYTPRPRARFDFDDMFFENGFGQTFGSEESATPTAERTPDPGAASRPVGSPDVVLS